MLSKLPRQGDRLVKRQIALAVLNSYLANAEFGTQHCEYHVHANIEREGKLSWTEVCSFWDASPGEGPDYCKDLREIVDHMPMDLETQVDVSVIGCSRRMASQGNDTPMEAAAKIHSWPLLPYDFSSLDREKN